MQIFLCSLRKPRSQNPRNGKPRKPRDDCTSFCQNFSLFTLMVKKLKISTLDGAETTHNNMKVRLSLGLPLILEVET